MTRKTYDELTGTPSVLLYLIGHCKKYRATGPHRAGVNVVDEFNSECTDSQLNAEHWFARIKKLYNRNRLFLCVSCLHKLSM